MEKQQPAAQKQKKAYSLGQFRVLIVEDYPFMGHLLASMLREFGVGKVVLANNGKEARQMIMMFNSDPYGSRDAIDFVITDWLMPEMSGIELIDWMRASDKETIRFLPSILCSAYTSEVVVKEGRDHGANEVLVKPVSADKIAKRILYVIDHPRPFIKSPNFFGPDRRRKDILWKQEERRVLKPEEIKEFHERI